jgi:hypothetical protein
MNELATTKGQVTGPPRIEKFRRELIKVIPRVPNNRASLLHMQQKHLPELLIDYVNWRSRYVGQRPRIVSIEPAAQADPRWSAHAAAIADFLDKVRRGDDLMGLNGQALRKLLQLPLSRCAGAFDRRDRFCVTKEVAVDEARRFLR